MDRFMSSLNRVKNGGSFGVSIPQIASSGPMLLFFKCVQFILLHGVHNFVPKVMIVFLKLNCLFQ